MVRKAAQADAKHKPVPNDDWIHPLLERLFQAEARNTAPEEKTLRIAMQIEQLADRLSLSHREL